MCISIISFYQSIERPYKHMMLNLFSTFSQIYPITAVALFVVASYASSRAYQLIQMNLNLLRKQETNDKHFIRLLALKNYYALVCETVDDINDCFGWILIVSMPFHFVAFVTASFYLFSNQDGLSFMSITYFSMHVFHLLILCCVADLVRDKVYREIQICYLFIN